MNFDKNISREGTYSVKYEECEKKFGSKDVIPLWVADMDLASPVCVTNALIRRAKHPIYGYTVYPQRFFKSIVTWMLKRHDWRIQDEWITPTPGVVPALNFIVKAFCEPNDFILIQPPVYHPFFRLAKNHDMKLLENPLIYENGKYKIDFDDFRAKAKKAKLFILCSPHNPIGRVYKKEELKAMADICLEENVLIVSDEIHADIVYDPHIHTPIASICDEIADITITLQAPSKTFNIAGLNTAYAIISNDSLRRTFVQELNSFALGMGNVFGIEALMAAYEGGEEWLNELLDYLKGNIDFVTNFLSENIPDIIPVKTEATYLMWLDCNATELKGKKLEEFFIQKAKLGLNAGSGFKGGSDGFMRLNIAVPRQLLEIAMQRLKIASSTGWNSKDYH